MNNLDIIKDLCKEKGISISKLEKTLNIGNGAIAKSTSNYMRSDRLKAIADYFGVTMEYLMTGEEDKGVAKRNPLLTDQERELLDMLRELNQEGRQKALEYIKDLHDMGKYKKGITREQTA